MIAKILTLVTKTDRDDRALSWQSDIMPMRAHYPSGYGWGFENTTPSSFITATALVDLR